MSTLELRLVRKGVVTGCHDVSGVRVNGEVVRDGVLEPLTAGQILSFDRTVEVIILSLNDAKVLRTGLPFARIDLLVLAGVDISGPATGIEKEKLLRELLMSLLPACDGKVVVVEGSGLGVSSPATQAVVPWSVVSVKEQELLGVVFKEIRKAEKRHVRTRG